MFSIMISYSLFHYYAQATSEAVSSTSCRKKVTNDFAICVFFFPHMSLLEIVRDMTNMDGLGQREIPTNFQIETN